MSSFEPSVRTTHPERLRLIERELRDEVKNRFLSGLPGPSWKTPDVKIELDERGHVVNPTPRPPGPPA